MKKIFLAQQNIKLRSFYGNNKYNRNNKHNRFTSDRFLQDLLSVLDTFENIYKLGEALKRLLSCYDLDKIRYQLARIPVLFRVVKDTWVGYNKSENNIGLIRGDFRFPLNPQHFEYRPYNVPDYVPDLETLHHSDPVWCLCSEKQAQMYQVDVPCWRETNSLVDWIIACVATEVRDEDNDVTQTPNIPAVVSEPVIETELTRTERIYQFIAENSPAPIRDILAQEIAKRSQTYKILDDLETAGRIENPKHGIYTVV